VRAATQSANDFRKQGLCGGFMSYGPDIVESFRVAAAYLDIILQGAKPAALPVEQPTKFQLAINLRTAKASPSPDPARTRRRRNRISSIDAVDGSSTGT
jgi:hypothetical protein